MIQRIRGRLSFANIMSLVAVSIALGGTSYAAIKLPSNSVSSVQIKAKAVKNSDLAANAVTSRQGPRRRAAGQGLRGSASFRPAPRATTA